YSACRRDTTVSHRTRPECIPPWRPATGHHDWQGLRHADNADRALLCPNVCGDHRFRFPTGEHQPLGYSYRAASGVIPGYDTSGQRARAQLQWNYLDRKSTRLNSSHGSISYAVFCLKKKKATTKSQSYTP